MSVKNSLTVKEMARLWLIEHKYDGLCTKDCGCTIEDLMPCAPDNGGLVDCIGGFKVKVTEPGAPEWLIVSSTGEEGNFRAERAE